MNASLFTAVVLLLQAPPSAPPPEAIFHNARVFTADESRAWAEAFAVRDGRIVAVGASMDLLKLAGPDTRVTDLGGNFVSPGFGDSLTADGAYAGFSEKDFGRIAPGLFADFVVLSRDLTRIAPKDILNTRVLLTVPGGKETHRARDFHPVTSPVKAR